MGLAEEDIDRRIRAKRYNEQLKLFVTTINTIALTLLGASVLLPLVAGGLGRFSWIWILVSTSLHLVAQASLRRLRSED